MTSELLRFDTDDGTSIVVEVDESEPGFQPAGRDEVIAKAKKSFEEALEDVKEAATKTLAVLRDGKLGPDTVEIEFGVRFNCEAGAVIAKTGAEGHLLVKMAWTAKS